MFYSAVCVVFYTDRTMKHSYQLEIGDAITLIVWHVTGKIGD